MGLLVIVLETALYMFALIIATISGFMLITTISWGIIEAIKYIAKPVVKAIKVIL